jgi:hypothetical protein
MLASKASGVSVKEDLPAPASAQSNRLPHEPETIS